MRMPQAGASGGGAGMPSSVLGVERACCRRPGYTPLLLAVVGPRGGLGEPPTSFRKKLSISIPTLALLSSLIVFTAGWQQYYPACRFYSPSCRERLSENSARP